MIEQKYRGIGISLQEAKPDFRVEGMLGCSCHDMEENASMEITMFLCDSI